MRSILQRYLAALLAFAGGLVRDLARYLVRDRKTTSAGVIAALAWLASHYNFVISEQMQEWIVMIALLVIAKLAKDSATGRKENSR